MLKLLKKSKNDSEKMLQNIFTMNLKRHLKVISI